MKNNNIEKTEFLKIVYFDEAAAQDYVDVTNGGRLDWSTQENKEKIAKIVAEIEAQAKSGFNILNYIKATFQGKVDASASAELTSAFDKTIKNTLLTDYIQAASKDEHVKKFENSGVYAPENSVTLYKMLSSYLTIVPKEEMPIDMEKLNEAILGERGYYDMLLKTEKERKSILRFNLQQLVKSGREYRWKKHDSVTISGNRWYRHSQSKGGYPVDFVMEFYYATFPEAVKILIGEEGEGRQKFCPAPSQDFRLPEKNEDNEIIIKYLTEKREIEKKLVEEWINRGDIYEEKKHHNVIFVGRDADGIPRYAHCRGSGEITYRGDVAGSDKSYGFSYRGTDNQLFVFEAAIDLLSFIQLFPKDWKKRSYLSLGGISSVALMTFLSERPQITSVFLCLDNDQAGNEACEKLAGEISEGYSVIRLKPSRKDWNEILCDKNADRKKAIAETITIKVPETEELVPMLCYEDIEQTSVEWLWFPYIPFGKLTIVQGNPGEGKTYFAMMLTAACTNGKLFPNMEDIEPFNVIYQTAEDGMGDTIKPRLVEAGANLSKVMVIDDSEEALTLSDDRIEKAVRQNHVRLVIIDQVQAFIGADVDMNRANEVRPVFRKLGMIAEKTGCAIVLIGHLNKSSGTQSTYRGLGSIDIMAAVRSLLFIGKVKKDPTTRVLIHEKSSLAPPGETMAFKLGDEEGFRWVGAYEISADDLLDGKEGKPTETKLQRGTKLIYELLADGNAVTIRELDEKAKAQGISQRTMREARSRMKEELDYQMNEKQENTIRLKK